MCFNNAWTRKLIPIDWIYDYHLMSVDILSAKNKDINVYRQITNFQQYQ